MGDFAGAFEPRALDRPDVLCGNLFERKLSPADLDEATSDIAPSGFAPPSPEGDEAAGVANDAATEGRADFIFVSKRSAPRAVGKDFRLRLPASSLQSA